MDFYGKLKNKSQAGVSFTVTVFLMLFISFLGQSLLLTFATVDSLVFVLVNGLFSPLAIGLVVLLDCLANKTNIKTSLQIKKFNSIYLVCSLLLSAGMFLGLGFLNEAVAKLLISWGLTVSAFNYNVTTIFELISLVIVYAILPAVFEESLFRGLIQNKLNKSTVVASVLLSGFVFSVYHCSLAQTVYQFVYGVMLAILVVKSKSIIPAIISHFLNNFVILTFNYLKINIDLFSPILIGVGLGLLLIFFVIIFVVDKKEEKTKQESKFPLDFLCWSALGLAVCIATAVLGAING